MVYKRNKIKDHSNYILTGTKKKCNCPFKLEGMKLSFLDNWCLMVVNGVHNHLELKHNEGHSCARRLSDEEIKIVIEIHRNVVIAKEIWHTLKRSGPSYCTTIKTIYNVIQAQNTIERAGWSQVQYFLSKQKSLATLNDIERF